MKCVLVGYGEIGKAVDNVFSGTHLISPHDPQQNYIVEPEVFDMLLVAMPYSKTFVDDVRTYQRNYAPISTLIFSTVPIGTCEKLDAAHCPVEGKHPDLTRSMRITDKWLGGRDDTAWRFLHEAGFRVIEMEHSEHTEWLKLRSTTVYGLNIEFARYSAKVCSDLGLDYEACKRWDEWVNGLYKTMQMPWYTRYVLDAPDGPKGGHCVTPNARLLQEQYPSVMVQQVAEPEPEDIDFLRGILADRRDQDREDDRVNAMWRSTL